ncbi:hypothetical protein SKAU_G00262440 [Synaphobranchus kaupii]|uniref:Multidrug and toxin extrusion protein n=1 Tax=Synaphobranchus kaupii TaxID=118154 RepID=A0A9Q1INU1_SYNKA|nr:hypothetical protein SKAU_G00262440 [Synaphobranchus kaupii]
MEKPGHSEVSGPLPGTGQVSEETVPSAKLFCCRFVRHWVPLAYREELYQVLRLTGPLLASRILNFLLSFVITIFCGHLGNGELAGYALASATFGGKNLERVGVILQRSMLILLLFCLPCWAILINTHSILLALQQEAEVARIAQLFVFAFLPAVPAMFLHQLQVAYLQNQGIILPQLYTAAVANIINVATNYILIFWMDLGVIGSAVANSLAQITICVLLFAYIRWKNLHKNTWGGWSTASLQEWGSYMQLAIPSTLMLCFEWWIYDIGGFFAGMLGEVDLAAQHVLLELGTITYMVLCMGQFPLGVHAAACVRVGNALGAGNTTRALITCKVTLVLSGVLAVFQGIVLGTSKTAIGYIFTSDKNIVELVSSVLTVYIFLQFFDALVCVSSGILLGSGKQKIAAMANLICCYCIGLPLGIALMFAAELRIMGLWLGLLTCVILQSCFFITLIFKLNWQRVTEEAMKRAGKNNRVVCMRSKRPIGEPMTDTLVLESTRTLDQATDNGVTQTVIDRNKASGYSAVSTQDQGRATLVGPSRAQEEPGDGEGRVEPKALLSVTQLVLRRGLTMLAAILILVAGVAAHLAFPPPDTPPRSNLTLHWSNSSTPAPPLNMSLSVS